MTRFTAFAVSVWLMHASFVQGQVYPQGSAPNGHVQTAAYEFCDCGLGPNCGCDLPPGCGMEPVCDYYDEPKCGSDFVEPGCGVIGDVSCGCGDPSCGLYGEPTCAFPAEPTCAFPTEPTCAFPTEPTCACGAPTCGLPGEPTCGFTIFAEPSCGLYGEPICGCGDPTCGLDGEPTCGLLGAPMCGCGSMISEPLCGCDYVEPTCGFQSGGIFSEPKLSMPNWLTWNSLSRKHLFTSLSGCRRSYFSVGFGLSESSDEARHIGTIANTFGGTPIYDIRSGALGRIGLGLDLGEVRLETEFGFRRNSVDLSRNGSGNLASEVFTVDGTRSSTTIMFNGYCDLNNGTFLTPYLKGGLGVSRNEVQTDLAVDVNNPAVIGALGLTGPTTIARSFPSNTSTEIAWLLGVGLALDLTRKTKFDLEYQYVDVGSSATGFDLNGDAFSFGGGGIHELTFGLRFYR